MNLERNTGNIIQLIPMKTLNTGQSYNLSEIFSGLHTKVVIPDLQRDYCWGGTGRLVCDFLHNIIEKGYVPKTRLPMGLLYGYEEPLGHIQLCDGQQRITTLFLLVGILNKKCNNQFQNILISEFEYKRDDKEPYLQYAIRENSLYFLSDLVCEFFMKPDGIPADIKRQSWYFSDYDNDPSIQSMLRALIDIDELLASASYCYIDKHDLAKYITTNLMFMYYDMGTRSSGEETFVIINTTGEPLSPTENLKPRYVTKYTDSSELWEDLEQWFWVNRNRSKNDTADNGLLEFLRWVILLETADTKEFEKVQDNLVKQAEVYRLDFELILKIQPETILHYFGVVKKLFSLYLTNNKVWLSPELINSQIEWLRILPLIAFCGKFPDAGEREVIRVKQFFKNIAQLTNVGKDISRLLSQAVGIIRKMTSSDIAQIIYLDKVSDQLLTEEERVKFSIFLKADNRTEVEDAFWKIQYKSDELTDGKIWQGEILPLIRWSEIDGVFSYNEFIKYRDVFYQVFDGKCDSNIDLTRRALITRELRDYPKYFRGQTNKSFGWEYNDWKVLITENPDKFYTFFKEIVHSNQAVVESLNKMCQNFPKESAWSEFVHIPELLSYCNEKNIQWWGDKHGWVLVKNKYTRGEHANVNAYKLYIELCQSSDKFWDNRGWKLWFYSYEGTCVVFDDEVAKISIDIKCADKANLFRIEVFMRTDGANTEAELRDYAVKYGLSYNGSRYIIDSIPKEMVVEKIRNML